MRQLQEGDLVEIDFDASDIHLGFSHRHVSDNIERDLGPAPWKIELITGGGLGDSVAVEGHKGLYYAKHFKKVSGLQVGDLVEINHQKRILHVGLLAHDQVEQRVTESIGPPPWRIRNVTPNTSIYTYIPEEDSLNIFLDGDGVSYKALHFRIFQSTDDKNKALLRKKDGGRK